MRSIWLDALLVVLAGPLSSLAGQAKHYDIRVSIDPPSGRLEAEATVTYVAPSGGIRAVEYLLNQSLGLRGLESSVPLAAVVRDTTRRGEHRIPQKGEPIRLAFQRPLIPGEQVTLTLRYSGGVAPDEWRENLLEEAWFELALYLPWFPYVPGDRSLTYTIDADVPPDYRVTGLGRVTGGDGHYRIVQSTPVNDIAIAGGRYLTRDTVARGDFRIVLSHARLRPEQIDSIASHAVRALARFEDRFGPARGRDLEFLFSPRGSGGGYARPGFIVMQLGSGDSVDSPSFLRYLGHEVAHLWWSQAPIDSWEDWLNESFAEYSALMLLREEYGEAEVERRLGQYRQSAATAPPIRGLDRDDPRAFESLYRKGPAILYDLEERVGRDRFLEVLRKLQREEVRSTDRLLAIVAGATSFADRDWLAAALGR